MGFVEIKVEYGEFERGRCSMAVLPNDERALDYTLACKTFPKGNMEIDLDIARQTEKISS